MPNEQYQSLFGLSGDALRTPAARRGLVVRPLRPAMVRELYPEPVAVDGVDGGAEARP